MVCILKALLVLNNFNKLYILKILRKTYYLTMKMKKKQNLPQKVCGVCNRPFYWRKKWEKVWDEVKYCSQKCKREARFK